MVIAACRKKSIAWSLTQSQTCSGRRRPTRTKISMAEGVNAENIDLIGNIMIDSFEMMRPRIEAATARSDLGLEKDGYALVTLHRPSNVDARETLEPIVDELVRLSSQLKVVFVAHPRTISGLEKYGLKSRLDNANGLQLLDPLPYVDFMNVVTGAKVVITDSGGLQEETTYIGIPCLTLRENTERPITVTQGTNKLVDVATLSESLDKIVANDWPAGQRPDLWDGKTASRAVTCLQRRVRERGEIGKT